MSPHFITTASLDWNDQGTPVAAAFDDVYFSNDDGLAETRYVFLGHNGLPERWINHDRSLFVVAETGFGTGLNVLATWQAFIDYRRQHPQGNTQRLHLISVEKFPLTHADLQQALGQWPELSILSERLLAEYPAAIGGCHRLHLADDVCLDLWLGDVAELLPQMEAGLAGKVDAWYLDGFAPSKNPEMWTPQLFAQLARLARSGATLATFTAAGFVRRGLNEAGFRVARVKGFGRKREMLAGVRGSDNRAPYPAPWFWRRPGRAGHTIIVGAGIAGATLAHALTRRGQKVTLLEQNAAPAMGASGNRQAAVYPLINGDHDHLSQFYLQAFLYGRRTLPTLAERHDVIHDWCGVVQLAYDAKSSAKIDKLLASPVARALVQPLTAEQVNARTGIAANLPGIEYSLGGWICPFELTAALLVEAQNTGLLECHYQTRVEQLARKDSQWHITTDGDSFCADTLVLANGHELTTWPQTRALALSPVRGQVNYQPSSPSIAPLNTVVCYEGYLTPAWQGAHCVGASYGRRQSALDYREQDEQDNLHKLVRTLPALDDLTPRAGAGRVSVRAACRDHLPLAGAAPDKTAQLQQYALMPRRKWEALPLADDHAGLFVMSGLGSRGLCSAPLLAELITAQLLDEPYPLSQGQLAVLNPNRHWVRKLLKGKPVE
ncbi:bifunctional tRNA (5-methylaminomethyl-2-thiouridine)(34)-methyltransferase MnmD/FAD-dependent 5-carboxymethylaminomethyl-2-thiouridine(34) oxidoreductase MnmC [Oceanisphaera sediminis]|uniref:tRNA 5-methylaminomethyl-2-thiouridine biosynthesis bifunctional protein MnmC n=1 Tax=Oceanisphaera sediminis TaxID=981381 RepID=A0ABP7DMK1_9GAMM